MFGQHPAIWAKVHFQMNSQSALVVVSSLPMWCSSAQRKGIRAAHGSHIFSSPVFGVLHLGVDVGLSVFAFPVGMTQAVVLLFFPFRFLFEFIAPEPDLPVKLGFLR